MKMASREQRDMTMSSEDESSPVSGDLRRGPWTVEEDLLLVNYIAAHGEGRWNALARCAGLKRTGKSCRLRWLNYLRPDLRRGNMTAQEQLLILELHSRWGNRWSKIAQHLPGRTDNEIKNYWRTRVQKHARQLNCDVNSQQFKDLMRYIWMPRLAERIIVKDDLAVTARLVTAAPPPPHLPPPPNNNDDNNEQQAELSCCTTAVSSSSSVSTDGVQQQQQPLVSPPPTDFWPSSSCGDNNDTYWCQQPPQTTTAPPASGAAAAETCWSAVLSTAAAETCLSAGLSSTAGSVYADMAALPDLGESMWWGAADDLWYTQILGL